MNKCPTLAIRGPTHNISHIEDWKKNLVNIKKVIEKFNVSVRFVRNIAYCLFPTVQLWMTNFSRKGHTLNHCFLKLKLVNLWNFWELTFRKTNCNYACIAFWKSHFLNYVAVNRMLFLLISIDVNVRVSL